MNARTSAAIRLALAAKRFPDLGPPDERGDESVSCEDHRDTALAEAIEMQVRTRWLTLVRVLDLCLQRPWERIEPELQAILLSGAAQLLLFDRLPVHAVINESVDIARKRVRAGAAGLTNAVLRRVADLPVEEAEASGTEWDRDVLPLGNGRGRRLRSAVFSENSMERCAEQTSHPPHFLMMLTNAEGHERTRYIAAHGIVRPPIIVSGAVKDDDLAMHPHQIAGFHVLEGGTPALASLMQRQPTVRVQDPASAAPAVLTDRSTPALIIDACAGRGTKTRQLRAMHPAATIVAYDINPARRESLRCCFADDACVTVPEPNELNAFRDQADLLVLDLPCSNTAVLPRRPEARYRTDRRSLSSLISLQRNIVAEMLTLRRSNGELLIATCSLLREENEHLAESVAAHHRLRIRRSERLLPMGIPGDAPTSYRDGSFAALLVSDC